MKFLGEEREGEGDRNEYLQQSSLPGAMDLQRNIHISEQFYEENVKKCTWPLQKQRARDVERGWQARYHAN